MPPFEKLVNTFFLTNSEYLKPYFPLLIEYYCNSNNPAARQKNVVVFWRHRNNMLLQLGADLYLETLSRIIEHFLGDLILIPETLKFLESTLSIINCAELNRTGWEHLTNILFHARSHVNTGRIKEYKANFQLLMKAYLQKGTACGYQRLFDLPMIAGDPESVIDTLETARLISEELREKREFCKEQKAILDAAMSTTNKRILQLSRDELHRLESSGYLELQIRYYSTYRSAEVLRTFLHLLFNSNEPCFHRVANQLVELCIAHAATEFLSDYAPSEYPSEFYADLWSSEPERLLLYFGEPVLLTFLLKALLCIGQVMNRETEQILLYLRAHGFSSVLDGNRALLSEELLDNFAEVERRLKASRYRDLKNE